MTNKHKNNVVFNTDYFEITKRELIASVSIIAILLLIGILIGEKISEHQMDMNEKYNKAVKIETQDLFEYGMRTNIGNAFVYGELSAVDPVTYPDLSNEYMFVEKVEERYTKHTKKVKHTREVNGKKETYYTTEEYWTWDRVGSESKTCSQLLFQGAVFPVGKIQIPSSSYIIAVKKNHNTRYKYYGTDARFVGTIFTELKDGTISNRTPFYKGMSIQKTIDHLETNYAIVIFWVCWGIFIVICVFVFYYIDNRWLE